MSGCHCGGYHCPGDCSPSDTCGCACHIKQYDCCNRCEPNAVPREAWKPGAIWMNVDRPRGTLKAVIVDAPAPGNHKVVDMTYLDGPFMGRTTRGTYKHTHMRRYFRYVAPCPKGCECPDCGRSLTSDVVD